MTLLAIIYGIMFCTSLFAFMCVVEALVSPHRVRGRWILVFMAVWAAVWWPICVPLWYAAVLDERRKG